ncbi:hypothetical protein D3868_18835 (plasmid) [Azospirillum brasilense]|uniref:Uncharacterized protein n=1 Tax=Azospirillum brasilense TaxID=192 RepID=A0A4D8QJL5_AZOBR|nr:hypothetical protein D3868_18835 [Azospirillum brasilense]
MRRTTHAGRCRTCGVRASPSLRWREADANTCLWRRFADLDPRRFDDRARARRETLSCWAIEVQPVLWHDPVLKTLDQPPTPDAGLRASGPFTLISISWPLRENDQGSLCGAAHGERTSERINQRNGYRERLWETRAGAVGVANAQAAQGGLLPRLPGTPVYR